MHNHSHHQSHQHSNSDQQDQRIGWAFFLNVTFTIIEFIGGWLTNSTAIMADAVHDLGDSLSLGFAWILSKLSNKKSPQEFSYGYKRLSLFGALINSIILITGSLFVLFESISRLSDPPMPMVEGMLALAILGTLVNGYAVYKLSAGNTLNEKVITWHLLEDVLGWIAVLIVSIVLMFIELPILDPLLSIGFTLFILFNVFRSLKSTISLFLQAVPSRMVQQEMLNLLKSKSPVGEVHHFHFWSLDGESHVLTAHLALKETLDISDIKLLKEEIAKDLAPFNLSHTTIEFEFPDEVCRDEKNSSHNSKPRY